MILNMETVDGGWAQIYRETNASMCWLKKYIASLCNWLV
jgi:hypothetical protein